MEEKSKEKTKNIKKITIRMKEEEYNKLKELMKKNDYKIINDYVLDCIFHAPIAKTDHEDMQKIYYEINRIGNNINQITKLINFDQKVDWEKINEIHRHFDQCTENIMKAVKSIQLIKKKEISEMAKIAKEIKESVE